MSLRELTAKNAAFTRLARRAFRPAVLRLVKDDEVISSGRFNGLYDFNLERGKAAQKRPRKSYRGT